MTGSSSQGGPLTPRPRVLLASLAVAGKDPRLLRQVRALDTHCDVTVAGFGPKPEEVRFFWSLRHWRGQETPSSRTVGDFFEFFLCALGLYWINYWCLKPEIWSMRQLLRNHQFDIIYCNHPEIIPVASKRARGETQILHDQAELWPDLFINPWKEKAVKKYRIWLMKTYVASTFAWSVVSKEIGHILQERFGWPHPIEVTNASPYQRFGASRVTPGCIELVHHGLWDPGRGIEILIAAMQETPEKYHLNLVLVNAPERALLRLADACGVAHRVHFHPPAPQGEVSRLINQFDVEVIAIQPINKNFELALPNKIFEAIQARLAILSTPLPEISRLIRTHQIGLVSEGFSASNFARQISKLTPEDVIRFKTNANSAAAKLNSQTEEQKIRSLVLGSVRAAHQIKSNSPQNDL